MNRFKENSDVVSWSTSRTVAVVVRPTGTLLEGENVKEALPKASVPMVLSAINFLPSFSPDGLE